MKILAQNPCSVSLWHGVVGPVLRSALISALKHGTNTQFGRPRPVPVRPGRALPRIFSGGSDGRSPSPSTMSKAIESRTQAYKRITDGIRSFVNHSVGATALILEAKRLEIWKDKWSSWQEYCEKEVGKSRQQVWRLLDVASTVDEIRNVTPGYTEDGTSLGILHEMTYRQAKELKGLPPEQKPEV